MKLHASQDTSGQQMVINVCACLCVFVHILSRMCVSVCMLPVSGWLCLCMCICVCACVYLCVCVCECVRECVCVYVSECFYSHWWQLLTFWGLFDSQGCFLTTGCGWLRRTSRRPPRPSVPRPQDDGLYLLLLSIFCDERYRSAVFRICLKRSVVHSFATCATHTSGGERGYWRW